MNTMRTRRHGRRARGFTLLEMMLVVVIIGLLAAVAVWNIAGQSDKARRGTTIGSLRTLSNVLASYYSEKAAYPPALETLTTLTPTMMDKIPKDSWKRPFVYYAPTQEANRPFTLISVGPDGQIGTTDDVNVWTMDDEP